MFGSPLSQHVYQGFEPAVAGTADFGSGAIQVRRELPPSPTLYSRRSSCGALSHDIDGEYLDKASPLAYRSPKVYNYPNLSPVLLPQQAIVTSESEALPDCQQRKTPGLSWLWKSVPDRETHQAGVDTIAGRIVRRASESAMGMISAYADAHTVCRKASAMPSPLDISSGRLDGLDPCHETHNAEEGLI